MGKETAIEWCDHTFNGWIGCTEVSTEDAGGGGCDNCYARTLDARHRWGGATHWGVGVSRHRTARSTWAQPQKWNDAHDAFVALHGRRQRVFCHSLADVFDNEVDPQWRCELFSLIDRTPNLDWLLLTKRIGNAAAMTHDAILPDQKPWPWPNVWLGATVVNQMEADRDIPKLLSVPARVRFLSCEPLLGAIDLLRIARQSNFHVEDEFHPKPFKPLHGLDWVICGGESGSKARPSHPGWHRFLRDQCAAAGVPFLFKQWGDWAPCEIKPPGVKPISVVTSSGRLLEGKAVFDERDDQHAEMICRFGKKVSGRMLDGRTHDAYPK